jgi:hypothetical protein
MERASRTARIHTTLILKNKGASNATLTAARAFKMKKGASHARMDSLCKAITHVKATAFKTSTLTPKILRAPLAPRTALPAYL